jgi:hypothetical protein
MNVDLLEMRGVRLSSFHVRETYRQPIRERHPQATIALCRTKFMHSGHFGQHGLRCIAAQQRSGCQLYL